MWGVAHVIVGPQTKHAILGLTRHPNKKEDPIRAANLRKQKAREEQGMGDAPPLPDNAAAQTEQEEEANLPSVDFRPARAAEVTASTPDRSRPPVRGAAVAAKHMLATTFGRKQKPKGGTDRSPSRGRGGKSGRTTEAGQSALPPRTAHRTEIDDTATVVTEGDDVHILERS